MLKKIFLIILSLFILILILVGCAKTKPLKLIEIKDVNLEEMQSDTITINTTARFFNPNRYRANVQSIDYIIFLDNERAAVGRIKNLNEIPPVDEFELTIPLKIAKDNWEIWRQALMDKDTVEVAIRSTVKTKVFFFKRTIHSLIKKNLALKSVVAEWINQEINKFQPKISNIKLESAGLLKQNIAAEIEYFNPYSFDIQLDSVNVDVYVNQNLLGEINVNQPLLLISKTTTKTAYRIPVNTFTVSSLVLSKLWDSSIEYQLKGTVRVNVAFFSIKIPVLISGSYTN